MIEIDKDTANKLLEEKYGKKPAEPKVVNSKKLESMRAPDEVSWELIAAERAELIIQFRDEAHAWWESYTKERERADKFENLYLGLVAEETKPQETKINVSSTEQINTRRARWPQFKAAAEKLSRLGPAERTEA